MSRVYRVTIRGQFVFRTDVEAESEEDAREEAEMDLEDAMPEVEIVGFTSVNVE